MRKLFFNILLIGTILFPLVIVSQTATPIYNSTNDSDNQEQILQSQSNSEFLKVEYKNELKIVQFYIDNIVDEVQKKNIYNSLLANSKIKNVEIDKQNLCIATIEKDVTPEMILEILKSHSAYFLFKSNEKSVEIKPTFKPVSVVFDAVKEYENNHRIVYLDINGLENQKQSTIVQEALLDLPEIYRFQNYDKKSYNKFMMECDSSVDEKFINEKILNILTKESKN